MPPRPELGALERAVVNELQDGFPLCDRPFAEAAERLGIGEQALIDCVAGMLEDGALTRFGPLFQVERMGGAFTLAAMRVAEPEFERIAAQVNAFPEVAHNYRREHAFNMWFVLACERPEQVAQTIARIESATGLPVHSFPKEREYFVELRLGA